MAAPMVTKGISLLGSELLKISSTHRLRSCRRLCSSICKGKSLIYHERGDPEKVITLQEQTLPEIDSDSVLVKMVAAPINPSDINAIQGIYPIQPSLPAVAGFEGLGEILQVGSNVTDMHQGERVIFPGRFTGTWRSHIVCPADAVMTVPEGTPPLVAATLRVNACTAYRMLADFEHLEEGDTVLQNAANSGAGQAVIQIAAARGLKTINIVRERPNLTELSDFLHGLGATVVTTESALRKEASTLLKGLPKPKLAINAVGGKSVISLIKNLQQGGTIVTYGGMSKQPVMVPTGSLIFNDIKFHGFWMSRWHEENTGGEASRQMFHDLCSWAKSGQLRAPQHKLVALEDYKTALKTAQAEFTTEKQILTF